MPNMAETAFSQHAVTWTLKLRDQQSTVSKQRCRYGGVSSTSTPTSAAERSLKDVCDRKTLASVCVKETTGFEV